MINDNRYRFSHNNVEFYLIAEKVISLASLADRRVSFGNQSRIALLQILDDRNGKRSTIITSQLTVYK
ncbi:MAG: ATP-binding protein [Bacteroidales bacterium]|jgi:hypothetical protein|nr:ATP-binding protein [Bacteroidales bacterium]